MIYSNRAVSYLIVLLEYIDIFHFDEQEFAQVSYYASIMFNGFRHLLCSLLCSIIGGSLTIASSLNFFCHFLGRENKQLLPQCYFAPQMGLRLYFLTTYNTDTSEQSTGRDKGRDSDPLWLLQLSYCHCLFFNHGCLLIYRKCSCG